MIIIIICVFLSRYKIISSEKVTATITSFSFTLMVLSFHEFVWCCTFIWCLTRIRWINVIVYRVCYLNPSCGLALCRYIVTFAFCIKHASTGMAVEKQPILPLKCQDVIEDNNCLQLQIVFVSSRCTEVRHRKAFSNIWLQYSYRTLQERRVNYSRVRLQNQFAVTRNETVVSTHSAVINVVSRAKFYVDI